MPCYIPDKFLVRVFAWFRDFSLHEAYMIIGKNRQSRVQSPESSKIVQKNTHKLTAEPLLLWINESPESRVQNHGLLDCSWVQTVQFYRPVHNHESSACRMAISLDKWGSRIMSPEYWISELIISPVDQSRNMSSVRTQWQLLWIHRHFTSYHTYSGASMCKKCVK